MRLPGLEVQILDPDYELSAQELDKLCPKYTFIKRVF